MRRLLRKLFWRGVQFMNGFLEGDQLWGRVRLAILLGLFLLPALTAVMIEFPLRQAASDAFYAGNPWMKAAPLSTLVPEPLIRLLVLTFSMRLLRFVLISFVALSTAMLAGAGFVQDVYELQDYWSALRYLIASMFSIAYPVLHIADGKKQLGPDEVNTLAEIGGPGYVLIAPGNAVLFERLHHPSNVRGAGFHFITRFESIKEIVDLKDQHWNVDKLQAISKDGLVVNTHDVHLRFRLWGSHREGGITGRNPVIPYPYSIQAVRNLVYNRQVRPDGIPSWGQAVQLVVDGEIQNYIRKNPVDAVTAPEPGRNPREEIKKAILSPGVRAALRNLGTELVWVDIGNFTIENPGVEEQRIQTWGSRWEGEADLLRAKGEAARGATIEMARAEAQAELLNRIADGLNEMDPLVLQDNQGRMARLFLLKVAQVLEDLRRPFNQPPTDKEP